jgi:hypothetical protein
MFRVPPPQPDSPVSLRQFPPSRNARDSGPFTGLVQSPCTEFARDSAVRPVYLEPLVVGVSFAVGHLLERNGERGPRQLGGLFTVAPCSQFSTSAAMWRPEAGEFGIGQAHACSPSAHLPPTEDWDDPQNRYTSEPVP